MKQYQIYYLSILVFAFILWITITYNINLNGQVEELNQQNLDLQLELVNKEMEIYSKSVDLALTEKELAETSQQLDKCLNELSTYEYINLEYVGDYKCTAYCCEKYPHICGTGSGKTASGAPVTPGISIAVTDLKKFPYGTILYIEDVGIRIVQDTGNFSKDKIDVAVETHEEALSWEGAGKHQVYIVSLGEGGE